MSRSSSPPPHPSYLALDAVAAGAANPQVEAHAQACDRCRQHLGQLAAHAQGPLPTWLRTLPAAAMSSPAAQLRRRRSNFFCRFRMWSRHALYPALALVPVVALALFMWARPEAQRLSSEPYIGVKAAGPMVWAYVKRGDDTFLWDGVSPVRAGDRLRLKIDAAAFAHVGAFGRAKDGKWHKLWAGAAGAKGPASLPVAWQIDDEPGDEHVLVVLSMEPVREADVSRLDSGSVPSTWWVAQLHFAKRAALPPTAAP